MKILNALQIKDVDSCSIERQGIRSIDLMERAASVFVEHIISYLSSDSILHIYCGKGNNGGDGLAISRMLVERGFSVVVIIVHHTSKASDDFLINFERLKRILPYTHIIEIREALDISKISVSSGAICIDAIFGSGVNKAAEGIVRVVIDYINQRYSKIYSVDVPSGLFLDRMNDLQDSIVRATHTFTFQLPKLSFLFPENADFVGQWRVLDIGLSLECIEAHSTSFYTIDDEFAKGVYIMRKDHYSKWDYGHCLVIGGSARMPGAAVMCVGAALRSGCGLVSVHSVKDVINHIIHHYPECIASIDFSLQYISQVPELSKYSAIAFGCGVSTEKDTQSALYSLLYQIQHQKIIIDADGLNILAENKEWLNLLPANQSIITPHIKEFDRLFGKHINHFARIQKAREVAHRFQIIVVLKSPYTAVILPTGEVYFNMHSNSALARGGSGDVLTGLIAGLCAQNYSVVSASILGVYIHALSAQFAIQHIHPQCVLPTDLMRYFTFAFNHLSK